MSILSIKTKLLLFSIIFILTCSGQDRPNVFETSTAKVGINKITEPQIAQYIRQIYQDKNGNFWYGTNSYGVAHFNGDSIAYFSIAEGFGGHQITGIAEDTDKNIWFSTDQGIVKYDWSINEDGRKQFTNYDKQIYFQDQHLWCVFVDRKGTIWAGSEKGVFHFDGINWVPFKLPYPEEILGQFVTDGTTFSITEDRVGNLWFSTHAYGAFKYDGQSFTQYTEKDGLTNNSIDQIFEDSKGNIWFGTRFGGLSRFDGEQFENFTQRNSIIGTNEIHVIYEDKAGNIWFSSKGYGIYRYDGQSFTNFYKEQGLHVRAVQTIFEDREGRFWAGGGGGLYRYDGQSFINVTKNGPWN